ncbi:MAG: ridA [Firmicutes bacterium]|nr:ridA [Bacillota bacterium]
MKTVVNTDKAPAAIGPYSQAIKAGGFLFVSGQLPVDPISGNIVDGGVGAQTKQSLANMKSILACQNVSMENVVKTTVFLANMNDFQTVNGIYAEYFSKEAPARSCVQVAKLPKDALVEIEAIAILG